MDHEDLTPEVMIALAAGDLHGATAKRALAMIKADEDLAMEYEGVRALVAELGPDSALAYLDDAHDRHRMRHAPHGSGGKGNRWIVALAVAACLLVTFLVLRPPGGSGPTEVALAVLSVPPPIEGVRGSGSIAWADAYHRGDHATVIGLIGEEPAPDPRECLVMAHSLLQVDPPDRARALAYLERAAAGGERYREESLVRAGALALLMGDVQRAEELLLQSRDHRANELRRSLTRQSR